MSAHPLGDAGWVPASPCTPSCLPEREPGRGRLRLVATVGVLLSAVAAAPLLPPRVGRWWTSRCARALLAVAGVRLVVHGTAYAPAGQGVLVVANHLSWIDVVAIEAVAPVRMVAKSEVARWPLIGGLAVRTGALFVDRRGLRSLPATVADTADALRSGDAVGVFPEGTTWCGAAGGAFRRAAFQAAIDAGVPVRPVAITMHAAGVPSRASAFVGDQTLLDSMRRVVGSRGLVCELTLLPLIEPGQHADRRSLAADAAEVIGAATGVRHGRRVAPRPVATAAPLAA